MTTPPTPADWYPDPENPAGLRYWDGNGWTEHRAPAQPHQQPVNEQPTADPQGAEGSPRGAHRAPDETQQEPSQPYDTHPTTSYEASSVARPAEASPVEATSWEAPLPSWDTPSTEQNPPPTRSFETPSYEPPSYEPPSYEQPPYGSAPSYGGAPSYEPASFTTPQGPPPGSPAEGVNKKLVAGILGGAAAILIVIVVVIVVALTRQTEPDVTSSGTSPANPPTANSETSTESSSASATAESPTLTPPPTPGEGSDGDYTFSVAGTETGDTITSTVSDSVQTSADGVYYVVYANVTNTGTSPLTFVATFQQLSAAGTTYTLDDAATAFLGGTTATIAPGDKVETPLVYDVPPDTQPDSIVLHADPSTPGVTLPLQ
jgi:uncharacterized protein DUF2510/uncharacterized protein DUF4352